MNWSCANSSEFFSEPKLPNGIIGFQSSGAVLTMPGDETPQQRRERYLRQVREADELASRSRDPEIVAAFRAIARSWERLAREVREK
jgi:alkanesulfonate monooxygenase SsuD/methylene tetrahydromethanopterin reductase-like flavin-dependent oxidoreductase (luciferase family)